MSRPNARLTFPNTRTRPSAGKGSETVGILGFSATISAISEAASKTSEAIRVLVNADESMRPGHIQFVNTEIRTLKDQIGLLEALLHTEGANTV